jgi:P27 family predicted phage terminase small subunit
MRARVVAAKTMQVGKKGGGKHWTKEDIAARAEAARDFERKDGAKIQSPIWLSKDALVIWKKKIGEIAGLSGGSELLDALDSEMLALYCDGIVRYKKLSQKKRLTVDDHRIMQTYMRRILDYSERLGFTPDARARLVKKRADGPGKDEFGEKFD